VKANGIENIFPKYFKEQTCDMVYAPLIKLTGSG
jgi:hypothetical protein